MKEAKITCLCSALYIQDLDLSMSMNQVAHVSLSASQASAEVQRLVRHGGIRVQTVERVAQVRADSPRKSAVVSRSAPVRAPVKVPRLRATTVDSRELMEAARAVARAETEMIVDRVTKDLEKRVSLMEKDLDSRLSNLGQEVKSLGESWPEEVRTILGEVTKELRSELSTLRDGAVSVSGNVEPDAPEPAPAKEDKPRRRRRKPAVKKES